MDICTACGKDAPVLTIKAKGSKKAKKDKQIHWICCDNCLNWFHTTCVRVNDALLPDISKFWYFCVKCAAIGLLIAKAPHQTTATDTEADIQSVAKKIEEITAEISKLKAELEECRRANKKQFDRLRSNFAEIECRDDKIAEKNELINNIQKKMEVIESGAKLASRCSSSVNSFRIAVNKIPFQEGESVRKLIEKLFDFLHLADVIPHITSCFRLQVKASKWKDRSLSPTIIVVFDSRETKEAVLRRYFEKYREVKLSILQSNLPLEYRFTINEVLSIESFRIRNLAIRLKQNKLVDSVFVRNDNVSIRLPNQKKYLPIRDTNHLLQLTSASGDPDETGDFFDAVSTNTSSASRL